MSLPDIRYLLESTLKTWADSRSPAIQVAWQNVPFTPPSALYLRSFLMPAETGSQTLDGEHRRYTGVYQVNVVAPVGVGPGVAENIAQGIADLFPMNQLLSMTGLDVYIVAPMSIHPAIQDSDRFTVPVSCRYRADTI